MKAIHLFWLIPVALIIGGLTTAKLFSFLLDYTMLETAELATNLLMEYKNHTYIVCGYSAQCVSDDVPKYIGGQCLQCTPKYMIYNYQNLSQINFSVYCNI